MTYQDLLLLKKMCSLSQEAGCSGLVKHLRTSLLSMQVEEHTPFARLYTPGEAPLPNDDAAALMFCTASTSLRFDWRACPRDGLLTGMLAAVAS